MADQATSEYPPFELLPLKVDGPHGNAWGRFGRSDQLGMLNLVTPHTVLAAAKEIRTGVRISLDSPLNKPSYPSFGRDPFRHKIRHKNPRIINDDILEFNTQCSSQWDGLRHYGLYYIHASATEMLMRCLAFQKSQQFYNGVTQKEIESTGVLGLDGSISRMQTFYCHS
jgi:hypothetical protein